ncbi:MAG TPA: hypothetical protein VGD39_04700, partial [Nocardioides sp.]
GGDVSTDLGRALRDAVADEPTFVVDPQALAHTGRHRLRRRNAIAVGTATLATAAVLVATSLVSRPSTSDPDPAPAERTVRLDLDDAVAVRPEVVASTRTTWRDEGKNSLEFDRLEGITTDGLVLRSRYTNAHGTTELGLLDPSTGSTDWLPDPPWRSGDIAGVDLGADRLVVVVRTHVYQYAISVLDRATRAWRPHTVVRLPAGTEVHTTARALVGPDDRLYLGSTMEGRSGPMHWWSAPVVGGGQMQPEPDLEGAAVAWGDDGTRVTADPEGHVVLSGPRGERVVGERRPAGCERPSGFPDAPPHAVAAGDRAVVTFYCDSGDPDVAVPLTVVYARGSLTRIEGGTALASDDRHLLVLGGDGSSHPTGSYVGETWIYLVDVDRSTVSRLGRGLHDRQVDVGAGMVLWNSPGRLDDKSVYDVTWSVAPLG